MSSSLKIGPWTLRQYSRPSSRVMPSLKRTIQATLYGLVGPSIIGCSSMCALMFQSQSTSNTLGPSSRIRCHAGVLIAFW